MTSGHQGNYTTLTDVTGIRHIRTDPCTPRTTGKVARIWRDNE